MRTIRLGGGLGFYGDSWKPARATLERGDVQYLCSDHLSELTLAILAKDQARDPAAGFTKDLVPMLRELLPLGPGVKFIHNAGGLNPLAAREALIKAGITAKIAVVTGDNVLDHPDLQPWPGFPPLPGTRLFANAYLGALPVVRALETGAQIVITGRVADAALFLAPLIHEFGWTALDLLAQGVVVGHLLECSAQATGGNFGGDWAAIPDLAHVGYPIAEVSEDGTAVITKAPGTGGRVSFDTLREQLLYEVHDPFNYQTPDVTVDLSTVRLEDLGDDRVRVRGATGKPAPARLKVVAGYPDGWAATCSVGYAWPNAMAKARMAAQILRTQLAEARIPALEILEEYPGFNSLHGPLAPPMDVDLNEAYLRLSIRTAERADAEKFTRLAPALGLAGPPFIGGYGGLQPARELLGFWAGSVPRLEGVVHAAG
ncbi:MAG: hypothetical protein JWM80_3075 [Cyanobacteria bacterium RYN_339]|nr:hypothetical protein [Cyanobacteria bacterium RYN_339]